MENREKKLYMAVRPRKTAPLRESAPPSITTPTRKMAWLPVAALLLASALLLTACATAATRYSTAKATAEAATTAATAADTAADTAATTTAVSTAAATAAATTAASTAAAAVSASAIDRDREGNPIAIPGAIGRVISIGPNCTEILIGLGYAGNIVAADEYSGTIAELPQGIPLFNMLAPDGEQIINLEPDVLFVTGMSKETGGSDLFKPVSDASVCVIYIPASQSISEIKDDIRFIAAVMGNPAAGEAITASMDKEIEEIRSIGGTIAEKKKVYFEISAAPMMYSFGKGVFLNEMLDLIGAINILADQDGWISVADESVLSANPDVILTSVDYIDDPIGEIKSRPGWGGIVAVRDGDVYYIDTDSSNRPSQNIIKALKEMAKAIYPDKYN